MTVAENYDFFRFYLFTTVQLTGQRLAVAKKIRCGSLCNRQFHLCCFRIIVKFIYLVEAMLSEVGIAWNQHRPALLRHIFPLNIELLFQSFKR